MRTVVSTFSRKFYFEPRISRMTRSVLECGGAPPLFESGYCPTIGTKSSLTTNESVLNL
jgi:hypothetical protein